jgi:hypothetical protein
MDRVPHEASQGSHFSAAFMGGGPKSGDMFCGRYAVHTNVCRYARACLCPHTNMDNPNHVCKWMTRDIVQGPTDIIQYTSLSDAQKKQACLWLHALSQHYVDNAMFKLQWEIGLSLSIFGPPLRLDATLSSTCCASSRLSSRQVRRL